MSPRRLDRISLRVASPDTSAPARTPALRWWLAAIVAPLAVAAATWLATAGLVVASWMTAPAGPLTDALRTGTQLWLLIHGAGARIGPLLITLTPLLLSAGVALLLVGAASYAARQAYAAHPGLVAAPGAWVRNLTAICAGTYVVAVLAATLLAGSPAQLPRALLGAVLISLPASYAGAALTLDYHPTRSWPAALRVVPKAAAAALGVVALAGALAALIAMGQHGARIHTLQASLHAGPIASVLLVLLQLAFAPDLLLWAMSYVLGAGFQVGIGTVVSPARVELGLLPSFPILGALPDSGSGHLALGWWLLSGVAAGAVAGWLVVRSRPPARADETALAGGLSGVVAGLAVSLTCAFSTGGLGSERLLVMGPRLTELTVLGTSTIGLAGVATGLILGLLRKPAPADPSPLDAVVHHGEPDEETDAAAHR